MTGIICPSMEQGALARAGGRRYHRAMHRYRATIEWARPADAAFTDQRYSRGHVWRFDGGVSVPASSAPSSVPLPYSIEAAVDPEEALVASVSSCHMLWFLSLAAKAKVVVERYTDEAEGVMDRDERGKMAVTQITLRPRIVYADPQPSAHQRRMLHHHAHEECFIANSLRTTVLVEERD